MRALDTVAGLAAFEQRGAGTDAERRAAVWLADEIEAGGREARVEPFWCRPNWALAHAWHVGLGLVGGLISVNSPRLGGALVLVALLSVIADEVLGVSLGRRLTPEHASQNVVALPRDQPSAPDTRLIITANYDAGRTGIVYRARVRAATARVRRAFGQRPPGWLGWIVIALAWELAVSIARLEGSNDGPVSVLQFVPTVGLVLALALLLELASSDFGPAAADNGSGAAVALGLTAALDAAPPHNVQVELVLQGAGDGGAVGLRRYLRARRRQRLATNTIVIGIGPCGSGQPRWWISDGPLIPLRYFRRLTELCAEVAGREHELHLGPQRGRGTTPALPARGARLPAIAIGCLDDRGIVPRSHQSSDTSEAAELGVLDDTLQFGLMLVDSIDAFLAARDEPTRGERPDGPPIAADSAHPLQAAADRER